MIVQDGAAVVAIFLQVSVAGLSNWVAGTPKIGAML
jgi:hypothetical protein